MLNTYLSKCGVIILAAGKSGRMGKPKFILEHASGETFLQRLIAVYTQAGIHEIGVIINDIDFRNYKQHFLNLPEQVKIIQNSNPEKGRLHSIQLGAMALSVNKPCFIHNIDNPFAETSLIIQLHSCLGEADFIKPVYLEKGGHPILVSAKIMAVLQKNANEFKDFKQVLNVFTGKGLEVEFEEVVLNINTEEEYAHFRKLIER